MARPILVLHEGATVTLKDLSERYGLTVETIRQRWLQGDTGAALVRPNRYTGKVIESPRPIPVDPAMQRLIDQWTAAVFGGGQ